MGGQHKTMAAILTLAILCLGCEQGPPTNDQVGAQIVANLNDKECARYYNVIRVTNLDSRPHPSDPNQVMYQGVAIVSGTGKIVNSVSDPCFVPFQWGNLTRLSPLFHGAGTLTTPVTAIYEKWESGWRVQTVEFG